MREIYQSKDLVFIVPTKDRPQQVKGMIESLSRQSAPFNRLIVVDGGESVEEIVKSYADRIKVEYYPCHPPGQIRQRNLALSKLDGKTSLVGFLDDDIVLEPTALEEMIECWNRNEENTAGISFNITNAPPFSFSWIKSLMGMDTSIPGRVLTSGYNAPLFPVEEDFQAQWLCGGATVWRQDILLKYTQKAVKTRWAIGEDLIFSYPVGKSYPLYVCATARVQYEHVHDHVSNQKQKYYGLNATLWRLYFVEAHPELKRSHFFWMIFSQILARFLKGIVRFKPAELQYSFGQMEGAVVGLMCLLRRKDMLSILEE